MPLSLYLVSFNKHSYDEYDAFVVAAESPDAAVQFLRDERIESWPGAAKHPLEIDWSEGYTVELIEPTEPGIILGSFNAG